MAICDMFEEYGAKAANFADLGGSAIHEQIEALLFLLEYDPSVNVIFIRCFGGILNVDKVVATVKLLLKKKQISKPLVIRVLGNRSENAKDMLNDLRDGLYFEEDLDKAVRLAIEISNKVKNQKATSSG